MDSLLLTYAALVVLAIWGVVLILRLRGLWLAWMAGVVVFAFIAWLALGTGFSIRIPQFHRKMVVINWTVHEERVHALAKPLNAPQAAPVHIVFSIDAGTRRGARMRKEFFDAVRRRQNERGRPKIVIDMWRQGVDAGVFKYELPRQLPPKSRRGR